MKRSSSESSESRRKQALTRVLSFTTIFLVFTFMSASRAGEDLDGRQQDIGREIKKIKDVLSKKNLEKKNISAQIHRVDIEISRAEYGIVSTQRELKKNRAEFNYLSRKLVELTEQYEQSLNQYRDRLVAYYKNGSVSYLEVLLNSASFSDFISRMHYLRMIAKNDQLSLGNLQDMCNEIETKRVEVENAENRIRKLNSELVGKKKVAVGIKREKDRILQQVKNDIGLNEKQLRELEEENRRIEEEIRRRQKDKPETRYTGPYGSPVCGRQMIVTSKFGPRRRPGRGASSNHRGVDLRASRGATVCAVADGVVFSAGYRRGYGYTVMIEHSTDLITLYAHGLKNIPVREGQKVRRGDLVLRADNSGTSFGNHLHFEVRKNGTTIDPLQYYRGQYVMK